MLKKIDSLTIKGLAAMVPKTKRRISDLTHLGIDLERITNNTGILETRVIKVENTAGDLCLSAAEKLIKDMSLDPQSIEALVFVSLNPDYCAPITSHIIHQKLNLSTDIPCFDILSGCNGYVYGLLQCAALIQGFGLNRILLLAGETPTKYLNQNDSATMALFGDSGSATLVERGSPSNIFVKSDGTGAFDIVCANSGTRYSDEPKLLKMNGANVFSFATREVPKALKEFYAFTGKEPNFYDYSIFHQANKMINDFILRKSKIQPEKNLSSMELFGNTGSGSIPLTIAANRNKLMNKKLNLLLCGFGVGLSWGICDLHIDDLFISELGEIE